jgi:FMN-dependent NADH-azoreductase
MPTLLHLDSSPLDSSITRELTRNFSAAWQAANPHGRVIVRTLSQNPPPPVDAAWITAAFTPETDRSAEQRALLALSDTLIAEIEAADTFVIGVPMHNFSIPSVLKLWLDQVVRAGRTFRYDANGPEGLLKGKNAVLMVASGGEYTPGTPMAALNFAEPYLRTVLGFLGVADVQVIHAGGAARLAAGAVDRATLLGPALSRIPEAVAGGLALPAA